MSSSKPLWKAAQQILQGVRRLHQDQSLSRVVGSPTQGQLEVARPLCPESTIRNGLLPNKALAPSLSHGMHGRQSPSPRNDKRRVTFTDRQGQRHLLQAADDESLLDIARANGLDLEGACDGSCACSTCHAIVESHEHWRKMGQPSEDENDMLDLAFGLTETSRLACQVRMSKDLDGLMIQLPSSKSDVRAL